MKPTLVTEKQIGEQKKVNKKEKNSFLLDIRIQEASIFLFQSSLSEFRLKNQKEFLWLLIIPRRSQVSELHDLTIDDSKTLVYEIYQSSAFLKTQFPKEKIEKINVAWLGN